MCDINLNFFESTDPNVISSLLLIDIDLESLKESYISLKSVISDDYSWVDGRKTKSGDIKAHGGFVKLNNNRIKAYILPKIHLLSFKKTAEDKSTIKKLDNIESQDIIIKGKNKNIIFSLKEDGTNILKFELCDLESEDEDIPDFDSSEDSDSDSDSDSEDDEDLNGYFEKFSGNKKDSLKDNFKSLHDAIHQFDNFTKNN